MCVNERGDIPEARLPGWFWWLIGGIVVVVVGFGAYVVYEPVPDWSRFDALTALFSGLAFAGMLGALYLQKQELALQRKELIDTRVVLKETSKANQEAAEIARRNLRAQYLSRWLDQNALTYSILERGLRRKAQSAMENTPFFYMHPSHGETCITAGEILRLYETYTAYTEELDSLTQPITSGDQEEPQDEPAAPPSS